jgi:hypothetical protein
MPPTASQNDLHQDCLANLNRALDLALKTAEAASTEGNHRVVIQAVREVTRIVTLINKMTQTSESKPKSKSNPSLFKNHGTGSRPGLAGSEIQAEHWQPETGNQPPEIQIPDLGPLCQPDASTGLDDLSLGLLQDISRNWAELQTLMPEAAKGNDKLFLPTKNVGNATTFSRKTAGGQGQTTR